MAAAIQCWERGIKQGHEEHGRALVPHPAVKAASADLTAYAAILAPVSLGESSTVTSFSYSFPSGDAKKTWKKCMHAQSCHYN